MKKTIVALAIFLLPAISFANICEIPEVPQTPPTTTDYTACDIDNNGKVDADDYFIFDLTYSRTGSYPTCTPSTPVTPTTPVIEASSPSVGGGSSNSQCLTFWPNTTIVTPCFLEIMAMRGISIEPTKTPVVKPIIKTIIKKVIYEGKG